MINYKVKNKMQRLIRAMKIKDKQKYESMNPHTGKSISTAYIKYEWIWRMNKLIR